MMTLNAIIVIKLAAAIVKQTHDMAFDPRNETHAGCTIQLASARHDGARPYSDDLPFVAEGKQWDRKPLE